MPKKRRSSWGSNEDAGRGRRRIRYWADLHDGSGYRRVSETIEGSRRDGDEALAMRRVRHSADAPVPTLTQAYELWWLPEARGRVERGAALLGDVHALGHAFAVKPFMPEPCGVPGV